MPHKVDIVLKAQLFHNRVLSAGGAKVLKLIEVDTAEIRQSLTLMLTDNDSYALVRQQLGDKIPIARHLFLKDTLLKVFISRSLNCIQK